MCTLYNLQIRKLINLRHLDISGTNLKDMPVKIGRLKRLRTLTTFVVGKSTGSSIRELTELTNLQGKLCILNLQNVFDAMVAFRANLKERKDLKELELEWGDKDAHDSTKERDVLDMLQPP